MAMPDSRQMAADHDEEVRYRAVQEQRHLPLRKSRAVLFAALGDESWRVRKQAVEVVLAARPDQDDIHQLIDLLRDEENAGLRNATAELLVRCGVRVVPILLDYLNDADHDLRKLVVDALGALGGEEALAGLTRALSDPDSNVAAAAAEGLGVAGNAESVPELLRHLEHNQEPFFRFNALAALGRIGVAGPLPAVVKQLAGQDLLRRAVFECLGKIGSDHDAVELLLEGVLSHLPSVRQAAVSSLAQVLQRLDAAGLSEAKARLQLLADKGLIEQLIAACTPASLGVNEAVVAILGLLADPRGLEVLFSALADERLAAAAESALRQLGLTAVRAANARFAITASVDERSALCRFIGNCGAPEGVETIRCALADTAAQVRIAAVYASAKLTDPELPAQVAELLNDEDALVRAAALAALLHYADSDLQVIGTAAKQLASAPDPEQRRGAALLFAAVQDGEQLARLLKDENASVRESAARAAGKLRPAEGCSHLMMALVDEEPDVRIAAAEALGDCRDDAAIAPLRLSLHDNDAWVQAAALRSLVQLAGEAALPDLLQLWEEGDEVVQLACLEAFEQIGSVAALEAVSRDLGRRDGEVLKGAVELLHRYDLSLLLPWFNHIICHQDWDVRITAVRASSALPAEDRTTLLQMALDREDNDLVRAEIRSQLGAD
ncbi:HEAT repeat domain-containing protein [Trichlorobacter lovleyi]|uniref:HEAT repeat domain-containing protein n=1 Tax=Trichlorobacter lovleyi TaxID=313985 RepID=UPI00223F0CC4|nr:HEAT repeat domain-containing protein [Trichlorobacter lovleyi]QOX79183.1 HEAT repeat domain-containing protein [Trichlorobacter lovleyi]